MSEKCIPSAGYSMVSSYAPFLSSRTTADTVSFKTPSPLEVNSVSVEEYNTGFI